MTKAVLFGVGETARLLAIYLNEKDVEIVGAFSRKTGVGQDIASHFELSVSNGRTISNDPAGDLAGLEAQVAIFATQSSIDSQIPLIEICAQHGVNVLSLAEEGFYPTPDNQLTFDRIDHIAKGAGISVFFGGVQDAFWWGVPLAMSGGSQAITGLTCKTFSNLDDLGSETVAEYPLNKSDAEFQAYLDAPQEDDGTQLNILVPAMRALLNALGMTVKSVEERLDPVFAEQDIVCTSLETTIPRGKTRGITETTEIKTVEGPTLTAEFSSIILSEGETERVHWRIEGEPTLDVLVDEFPGYEVTAASLINRIPDVISAAPGYITVNDLPVNRCRSIRGAKV